MLNDKRETPLHLAVKSQWKKDLSTKVLSALLKTEKVDPLKRDQSGKRPLDYLSKRDIRVDKLEQAMCKSNPDLSWKKKKPSKQKNRSDAQVKKLDFSVTQNIKDTIYVHDRNCTSLTSDPYEDKSAFSSYTGEESDMSTFQNVAAIASVGETRNMKAINEKPKVDSPCPEYESLSSSEKLDYLVKNILENAPIPSKNIDQVSTSELVTLNSSIRDGTMKNRQQQPVIENQATSTIPDMDRSYSVEKDDPNQARTQVSDRQTTKDTFADYGLDFDNLPWEVEVTPKVMKFFKNTKKSSFTTRQAAAKTILMLAEGKRNDHLSKCVSSEMSLQLHEARITKAVRLLWEKAISYSAKLTETLKTVVYTHVIRVWEIVLDHDDLDKRIKYCTEQIEKSHRRGFEASVKQSLLPQTVREVEGREKVRGRETIDIPEIFKPITDYETSEHQFIPAASTRDNEYNVTTFYSFDTITARSMLLGANDRRDFPIKEWPNEHEIIKLISREAVLLLGRSGTGKTTCCLYRLWNEFKNFWNPESKTFGWKLPHRCLIPSSVLKIPTESDVVINDRDETELQEFKTYQNPKSKTVGCKIPSKSFMLPVVLQSSSSQEAKEDGHDKEFSMESYKLADIDAAQKAIASPLSCEGVSDHSAVASSASCLSKWVETEENLHQVFVTKNRILCDYMKKSFYSMAAAHEFLEPHMTYENINLPSNLSQVTDEAFPLFLTARQFYVLLDNSIGGAPTFFPRDEKGNIQVRIASTDYDDDYRKIVLGLTEGMGALPSSKQQMLKWTEVTALYFKDHIWKKISRQHAANCKGFEPLLVWTEIQSFIKGSEIALRKGEPLSRREYKEVGDRMAPSFASCRDIIYDIFNEYQHYRQMKRHEIYLYDECDLILHIHNRMKDVHDVPWSIHSLYIDEVQDFTQAELAILTHCSRDPNSMFFTGDTAQTIMRGVAFRFQDLRSLFHRINSKIPVINVPQKPYNLTINFRSHSGILKLAGSIIDLISEFFKDSIDRLPGDRSMFQGPIPVFVESCEVNDLALLLRTNKREASPIEFGAHQVILVQSKEARDSLPSILRGAIVLTVFEAKGLEFDDVLLYNFFTDSMVSIHTHHT